MFHGSQEPSLGRSGFLLNRNLPKRLVYPVIILLFTQPKSLYKLTWPFLGMVKKECFIVDMREQPEASEESPAERKRSMNMARAM